MAARPTLFVGLDGPVLVPSQRPDILRKAGIVPYAKPFLFWATTCFKVLWITQRPPSHAFRVASCSVCLAMPSPTPATSGHGPRP